LALAWVGIDGPAWLSDPALALYSVALIDIWKGVGLATLIYIAGLAAISPDYYEASRIDGATRWQQFWRVTVPLVRPATVTVVTLSLIGGLRSFDIIWATTRGGPGFASDVLASVIYKQYQAGFYGLGDGRKRDPVPPDRDHHPAADLVVQQARGRAVSLRRTAARRRNIGIIALLVATVIFILPFIFIFFMAVKTKQEAALFLFTWPSEWQFWQNLVDVVQTRNYMLLLAYFNSIVITVGAVTLLVIFGAMVGYVLQRRPRAGTR
jgi:ABC-type sugar transport system permease subunit